MVETASCVIVMDSEADVVEFACRDGVVALASCGQRAFEDDGPMVAALLAFGLDEALASAHVARIENMAIDGFFALAAAELDHVHEFALLESCLDVGVGFELIPSTTGLAGHLKASTRFLDVLVDAIIPAQSLGFGMPLGGVAGIRHAAQIFVAGGPAAPTIL